MSLRTLGEICEFKYGKSLPEGKRAPGRIDVYGSNGPVGSHSEAITDGPTIVIGRKGSVGEVNFSDTGCWPIDTTYYVDRSCTAQHHKWLFYALGKLCLPRLNKATGVPGFNRSDAYEQKLFVPPINEQERIAGILDQADSLRRLRQRAIDRLSPLLRSTFLTLFGDPVTNPFDFPIQSLPTFYISPQDGTKCGPFGSALRKDEIVESGIPVWNMDNIDISGRMVPPFRMWITQEKFKELIAYSVIDGDVLISRAGTVGKMCVANSGCAASVISTNLIRIRFGPDLLPIYFVSLMTYCKGSIGRLRTGPDGSFTHMNTGVLDKLKFPYPPLDLQRRFAAVVESVEEQRAYLCTHLAELDALFLSLQHRAFCGDL